MAEEFGFSGVPRLVADSMDEESIRAMAERTRVVCTTVGPYALYGEPLVKICAELGVHYRPHGEVQWMRDMIEAYHATAEASGAKLFTPAGSIVSRLTWVCIFVQQAFLDRFSARPMRFIIG